MQASNSVVATSVILTSAVVTSVIYQQGGREEPLELYQLVNSQLPVSIRTPPWSTTWDHHQKYHSIVMIIDHTLHENNQMWCPINIITAMYWWPRSKEEVTSGIFRHICSLLLTFPPNPPSFPLFPLYFLYPQFLTWRLAPFGISPRIIFFCICVSLC